MPSRYVAHIRYAFVFLSISVSSAKPSAHAQCAHVAFKSFGATDPASNDLAGMSLATNARGDRVAFGSGGHSHASVNEGAVWIQTQVANQTFVGVELRPTLPVSGIGFGAAVAMNGNGDVLLVGAPSGSPSANHPRAYVFRDVGGTWVEEWSVILPSPAGSGFGRSVAMDDSGTLVAVGAPMHTFAPGGAFQYGAVYVYRREPLGWVLEKQVTQLYTSYTLGAVIALSGDGEILAARSHSGAVNGSVFLFSRDSGAWNQIAHLRETIPHSTGGFGSSVDLDARGDTVVVGSQLDSRMGYAAGALFLFRRGATAWSLEAELLPPPNSDTFSLGMAASINAAGDRAFAFAPGYTATHDYAGAVVAFRRTAGTWQQQSVLFSTQQEKDAGFGKRICSSATGMRFVASEWAANLYGLNTGRIHVLESPCTDPQSYCTAQTNSLGCLPAIGWQGSPSASSASGFLIIATSVRNQSSGLLFYGTDGSAAQPWNGGTVCVRGPLRRTPIQSTGGSTPPAVDCTGALTIDFNTWQSTTFDPALFAGQHVFAQYLSRDPSPTTQVNLTDAVEFYLTP